MGRFLSDGTAPANAQATFLPTECYVVDEHKYQYDQNSCWQNRVMLDTPGSYTFTVPSGVTSFRAVAVGGGGKSYVTLPNCCGTGGGGGGYSEKIFTVTGGDTVSVVVGKQQQDTTVTHTPSSTVLTGGGATGPTPGTASGGDWNSIGGEGGCSYSTRSCGSCIYTYSTTCCGYCVVWSGVSARQIDPPHNSTNCCQAQYPGGASAGSWIWTCGGKGQNVRCCANYGAVGGGGGGIGYIQRGIMCNACCTCICIRGGYNGRCWGDNQRNAYYMGGSGGGGGTLWQCESWFDCQTWAGTCNEGVWKNGDGGWGAPVNNEGRGQQMHWGYNSGPNSHMDSWVQDVPQGPSPRRYYWHDVYDIQGSGSSARGMSSTCWGSMDWSTNFYDCYPDNAGEGAGTGAITYNCCTACFYIQNCCIGGATACGSINWNLVCCLGEANKVCCADRMEQALFPFILACAGIFGGTGGTSVCHFSQKAGKGGGAGVNRSYILCICYGGNFDYCNGNASNPLLAFPPEELDWRATPAGTGVAILYWKDA